MDDKKLIDLFWQRSEQAIAAADKKYGKMYAAMGRRTLLWAMCLHN